LPCILVTRHNIYFVFSEFTCRSTSLLASVEVSVFMVSILSPSRFTSSAQTSS
jgi:hypothetical protein